MEGFNQERRGLFDGLKVPFDVNAILLAAMGVVAFLIGVKGIELVLDIPDRAPLLLGIVTSITGKMGYLGLKIEDVFNLGHERPSYPPMAWIAFVLWFSAVWGFFSAAICRIAAMKIAREEGLELKDAIKFGVAKFVPNVLSIVFVIAIVGFFYLVCNATIAGWVGRIPYVGEILVAVLFFLVLLSSFFIVFAGVLGVLGFNLAAAAIATEASDTFDGVSRAWNYILARPWQVILTYSLTFAYICLFLFCGHVFEKVAVKSLSLGGWGMGHKPRIIEAGSLARELHVADERQKIAIPGKAEFLYKKLVTMDPYFAGDESRETVAGETRDVLYYEQTDPNGAPILDIRRGTPLSSTDGAPERGVPDTNPKHSGRIDVYPAIEGSLKFTAGVIWLWLLLAKLIIWAYAVSYFFSAMTTIYFLLRKDVEGDDYTEINLEDEDEDEEAFESATADAKGGKPEEKRALPVVGTPAGGEAKKDDDHKH